MTFARLLVALLATLAGGGVAASEKSPSQADAEALFVRRVAPLLQSKCMACHGGDPEKIEGGLDLRTAPGVLRGGDSGEAALVAGKPHESPLVMAAERNSDAWSPMPPKEAEKLTAEQIGWLKDWIAAGAVWPDEARTRELMKANADKWSAEDGIAVATSGGLTPEWTNRKYKPDGLWAYQPVRKPNVSAPNPIDELLATKLPPGVTVAPPADAVTFIRRATFDLTGLPPTPEEVEEFVRAYSSTPQLPTGDKVGESESRGVHEKAYEALVDKLLASPHYGERMAQHWLDVVRYADSSGFANDFERGNAWRYRDYVVRSFNNDKPYDQFIREQIAGDELDPNDPEQLVAVGFLRMGPWELTGMEVAKLARQRFLDDVTNSVGETFLAHSLQCARCHDHKFDPVPTGDYYAIQAVFATTQLCERPAPFLPAENIAGFEEQQYLHKRQADYIATLKQLDEKMLAAAEAWFREKEIDPMAWNAAVAEARDTKQKKGKREAGGVFNAARNSLLVQKVLEDQFPPKFLGFTPEDYGNERVARKGVERLKWEFDRYQPIALSVYDGRTPEVKAVFTPLRMPVDRMTAGELEETCILTGGDPFSPGRRVRPGALSVLAASSGSREPIADAIEGRRLVFADWVADARNPLTTRAIVNRVWLWHFGQPLAGNPNNFGSTGKRPTHPELLDWLAATFVKRGWSFKELHRVILNSEAYRRGTQHPDRATLDKLDPTGTSYAVFSPRRLTAEELRDAMLAATGELNRTLGGIPNRPEINLEAALQPRQVMGTFAAAWTPNPRPEDRHRRSLYALRLRGLADPALEVFNAPGPDFSCERREASTVTPQVFALFNSKASQARALALAARVLQETESDESALDRCFLLLFGRNPNAAELAACLDHVRAMEALQAKATFARSTPPLEVRRDAVEENTGEKFSFQEKLHANADFVPDLQPADCDAHTRAWADLCLVLLNTNEFAYVY